MSEYSASTQFIDLAAQQKTIRSKLDLAIGRVLDHGQYIMGPEVKEFEANLKEFSGAQHALTCANGTDALTLVLMSWGIGCGDAVFVPSFTYVATAGAPAQLGATPFFVDVCEDTFNIDPESFKQAIIDSRELGLKPAVVIAVDLFGQPADIDGINEVARAEKIKVLIDGAQSFGATSKGRRVGTMGNATTTSFFPAKPLGCYGDGGAIFTDNDEDAVLMRSLSLHGKGSEKYDNVRIGLNSRLDTIQAAILIEKLKIFPEEIVKRNELAEFYSKGLKGFLNVPQVPRGHESTWAQYTLVSKSRNEILAHLEKSSIPAVVYYPKPLSKQTGYHSYPSVSSGTQVSHVLSESVFSIPMHPYLPLAQAENIVSILSDFCE